MINKVQLEEYLQEFKNLVNTNKIGTIKEIELFSGIKPADYYVPQILDYLDNPPYKDEPRSIELAWFVEIFIDHMCIWRKSMLNKTGENLQQYEEPLLKEIFKEIIFYGLDSSWNMIKNR